MKTTYLIATTVICLALAAPLAAHHNSPADPEIGDMMGMHEYAIDNLDNTMGSMDPSNDESIESSEGSMPEDTGQSNRVGIPVDPEMDNGGNRGGW